jgi:uncharacterized protein YaaN involved in tellurite resistance
MFNIFKKSKKSKNEIENIIKDLSAATSCGIDASNKLMETMIKERNEYYKATFK